MQSTPDRDSALPELGKCQLVAQLARGETANVYLATLAGFNRLVAVKELRPELADDSARVAAFVGEARLATRIDHPNVVRAIDFGADGNRCYATMEFLDGRSLDRFGQRLVAQGRLSVGGYLSVIADCLLGLHHAHELRDADGVAAGVVHRGFNPHNLFVTFDGGTKILQFGVHQSSSVLRRVAYLAPEQAWGQELDRRADVYSAGAMIWEVAAGRRLWPGLSEVETLARLLQEGAPLLRSVRPDAPAELEAICAHAMERDRTDRYESALELHAELVAHLATREDTMTTREVAAVIGRVFAHERRQLAALLDEALRKRVQFRRPGEEGRSRAEDGGHEAPMRVPPRDSDMAWSERISSPETPGAPMGGLPLVRSDRDPLPPVSRTSLRSSLPLGRDHRWTLGAAALLATAATVATVTRGRLSREGARVVTAAEIAPCVATPAPVAPRPVVPPPPPAPPTPCEPAPAQTPTAVPPRRSSAATGSGERARSARPLGTTASAPATPPPATSPPPAPAPTTIELDPAGGRAPHRPIVTLNPYESR